MPKIVGRLTLQTQARHASQEWTDHPSNSVHSGRGINGHGRKDMHLRESPAPG